MELFTKTQLAELAVAPIDDEGTGIKQSTALRIASYSDVRLIRSFRKSTGLYAKLFAPGMFYICYDQYLKL